MHSICGLLGLTSRHHAYMALWIGYSIHNYGRTYGSLGWRGRPTRPLPLRRNSMSRVLHLTLSIRFASLRMKVVPVDKRCTCDQAWVVPSTSGWASTSAMQDFNATHPTHTTCSIRQGPSPMKEARYSTVCRKGVELFLGNWVSISKR